VTLEYADVGSLAVIISVPNRAERPAMSTRKSIVRKGAYKAKDEQGQEHLIHVYVDILETTFLDGSRDRSEGLESHKMAANGNHVNVNDDGTLEEVRTGRVMRRI
jgi:hypothetical protein